MVFIRAQSNFQYTFKHFLRLQIQHEDFTKTFEKRQTLPQRQLRILKTAIRTENI